MKKCLIELMEKVAEAAGGIFKASVLFVNVTFGFMFFI